MLAPFEHAFMEHPNLTSIFVIQLITPHLRAYDEWKRGLSATLWRLLEDRAPVHLLTCVQRHESVIARRRCLNE